MARDETFGVLLRRLRLAADLTLEQLAEASGVSDRGISDMERGVSKGPRVRTVEAIADVLAKSDGEREALLAAARAGRAASKPATLGRPPMPRRLADFTGRAEELARIKGWADAVVVISGPPGVGKTSLALQAAQSWEAADQLFVDLRGLDAEPLTPAAALGRLIRMLSPDAGSLPREVDELAAYWHTLVQGRSMVVVLDNAVSEGQVRPILPPHGPTTVIVTSRRALSGLEGVRRLLLDPLPQADAVRLLSAILEQAIPEQAIPEQAIPERDSAELDRIAELCVNLPLALRIAANRLVSRPGWTPGDLISRLAAQERRLDALSAGDLRIKATFTLSYQQLSGVARRLFRRLALVPGSSTGVELAAVLAREPVATTEDALDELVDLSLLQQRNDGRLQFHDLLRLYAGTELDREEDPADRAATIRRRDDWLLDTTVSAGLLFEPGATVEEPAFSTTEAAGEWLRTEAENWFPVLAQAAADGDDQRVIDVAESLHWFSDGWATWPNWLDVFTLSTEAARRLGDERLQAVHLGYVAWVHIVCLGRSEDGLVSAKEALDHAGRSGDLTQIAWANYYVCWALGWMNRYPEALPYSEQAVASFRRTGDREGLPNALLQQGDMLRRAGRHDDALARFAEVIALVHDPRTVPPEHVALMAETVAHSLSTEISLDAGRWDEAYVLAGEALEIAERLQHSSRVVTALMWRARAQNGRGDVDDARADLQKIKDMVSRTGERVFVTETMRKLIAELESVLENGQEPPKPIR